MANERCAKVQKLILEIDKLAKDIYEIVAEDNVNQIVTEDVNQIVSKDKWCVYLQRIGGEKECKKDIKPSTLVKDIVPRDCQKVFICGKAYTNLNVKLQDIGDDNLLIIIPKLTNIPKNNEIYLKRQNGISSISLDHIHTVADLEKEIEVLENVPQLYFYLRFGWQILISSKYLFEYGIVSGSIIELFISAADAVRRVKIRWEINECAICLEEIKFGFQRQNQLAMNQTFECCHCFHTSCSRDLKVCPLCNKIWLQDI
jgi:hypothetical protein